MAIITSLRITASSSIFNFLDDFHVPGSCQNNDNILVPGTCIIQEILISSQFYFNVFINKYLLLPPIIYLAIKINQGSIQIQVNIKYLLIFL